MDARARAIQLLAHYLKIASEGGTVDDADNVTEIESIIDYVISAAMQRAESNKIEPNKDSEIESLVRKLYPKATAVKIFINCEECAIKVHSRTPEDLKRSGFSMRSLDGEWIK